MGGGGRRFEGSSSKWRVVEMMGQSDGLVLAD